MNKKLIFALYTLVIVCIGFATVIEKYQSTSYVSEHIYGAWWFSALWAVLTVSSLAYIVKQQLYRRLAVLLLHLSFVVILAGALTTHLFSKSGTVNLRIGESQSTYTEDDGQEEPLPSPLTLKEFNIINYPGTDAPLDYQSIISHDRGEDIIVSMNNVGHLDGYRFFQSSYDSDGKGVSLGVSYDPWGIGITYFGYLSLLLGIIATLLSRKTGMRALYHKAMKPLALLLPLLLCTQSARADENLQSVDQDIAHRIGSINVLYNNRICPLNTVATDFVTKLTGSASWQGYTADEIFTSWMIYYSPWEHQKLIRVKGKSVQKLLGIEGSWASFADFLNEYHEYKLQGAVDAARRGDETTDKKSLIDADEKYHIVEMFYRGQFLRMFPYTIRGTVNWYSPGGQTLPREIPVKEQFFIKQSMDFLTESIVTGQRERALEIISKIKFFQRSMIGDVLPSESKTSIELAYNTVRSKKWPVFLSLTISLLLCIVLQTHKSTKKCLRIASHIFVILLSAYVTIMLLMRWWLSGHIPVSNGHETMLFMSWVILLLTLALRRRFSIILGFGPLIASFCLLVAMLAGSSTQITPLMPVLQSPLLSVHVMTVMCAYALFALQTVLGIQSFYLLRKKREAELERVTALSQLLLYPAVFLLAIGIFLGAVWANVSWGTYWSWDPKESWALITLMVYAVPLHRASISRMRHPRFYHTYMICSFLAVLITYFGVNYLLGGMHSYA